MRLEREQAGGAGDAGGHLTTHFTFRDARIERVALPIIISNVIDLAWNLETIRDEAGPLRVVSWFRPPSLAHAITSSMDGGHGWHACGLAVDFVGVGSFADPRGLARLLDGMMREGRIRPGGVDAARGRERERLGLGRLERATGPGSA
jgi:hypothetical protein